MGTVSVVGRWPMKGDPAALIHDADCEGRRLWFDTPDEVVELSTLTDFPCWCVDREIAAVARLAHALLSDNQPWLPGSDPRRTAWLARLDEYATRKAAVTACIKGSGD